MLGNGNTILVDVCFGSEVAISMTFDAVSKIFGLLFFSLFKKTLDDIGDLSLSTRRADGRTAINRARVPIVPPRHVWRGGGDSGHVRARFPPVAGSEKRHRRNRLFTR
jgi:hypothetical protein